MTKSLDSIAPFSFAQNQPSPESGLDFARRVCAHYSLKVGPSAFSDGFAGFRTGFLLTALLILLSLLAVEPLNANGSGLFRRAYSLESSDPEAAIQNYRAAISQGLPANLRRAAVWKVYFLYKRNHYYIQAYRYGNSIGAGGSHQSEIMRNALHRWGITSSDFNALVKAWPGSGLADTANDIIARRSRKGPVLAADLRRALELEGRGDVASRVVVRRPDSKTGNDPDLEQAEYFYSQGDLAGAERILWKKANSEENLGSAARSRVLYLLGKIRLKQNKEEEAIRFYRLAAGYATDTESRRLLALASYRLYRTGKKDAAYELIDQFPDPSEDRMKLYFLVVAVDAADNPNALRRLKSMEAELKERVRLGQAGFLERKALGLLQGR